MDDATGADLAPRCPWCSAELAADATACTSCGATLTSADGDQQIPGVTTVAATTPAALQRPARTNRLLRWISGEPSDDVVAPLPPPGSLEPPPAEVRREIRRLELEAELTNLSAEASAIAADDALEARAANDEVGAEAALQVARDARAVTQAIDLEDAEAFAEGTGAAEAEAARDEEVADAADAPAADAPATDASGMDAPDATDPAAAPTSPEPAAPASAEPPATA